jgi:hypothetical protein
MPTLSDKRLPLAYVASGFFGALCVAGLAFGRLAHASVNLGTDNASLVGQMEKLTVQVAAEKQDLTTLHAQVLVLKRTANAMPATNPISPFVVSGTTVTLSGYNLVVNNGAGTTNTVNGTGNIIIGYDGTRGGTSDVRTGSKNLILGDENNYSSYGGLVAGNNNSITAPYATVSGGIANLSDGQDSAVLGGAYNTANGQNSVVCGGGDNTSSGDESAVSGGNSNDATSENSAVSGGDNNTASGENASVSGGGSRTADTDEGWGAGTYHSP